MKEHIKTLEEKCKVEFQERLYEVMVIDHQIDCKDCNKEKINENCKLYVDPYGYAEVYCLDCLKDKRDEYIAKELLRKIWEAMSE